MTALREIEFEFVLMICFTKKTNYDCEVEGQSVYFNQSTSLKYTMVMSHFNHVKTNWSDGSVRNLPVLLM